MTAKLIDDLEPIAATKAKVNLGNVLYEVSVNRKRFVVNRQGRPVAVILGYNEYEALLANGGDGGE